MVESTVAASSWDRVGGPDAKPPYWNNEIHTLSLDWKCYFWMVWENLEVTYLLFIAGLFTYFEKYFFLDPPMIELSIVFSPKIVLLKSQRQQAPVKLCLFVYRNKIIISLIH